MVVSLGVVNWRVQKKMLRSVMRLEGERGGFSERVLSVGVVNRRVLGCSFWSQLEGAKIVAHLCSHDCKGNTLQTETVLSLDVPMWPRGCLYPEH